MNISFVCSYYKGSNGVCGQCGWAKRLSQEHINIPGRLEIPHIFVDPQQHPGSTQEIAIDLRSEGTDTFPVSPFSLLFCPSRSLLEMKKSCKVGTFFWQSEPMLEETVQNINERKLPNLCRVSFV